MKVLSAPGTGCPREDDPRKHIPDSGEPVDVPNTMYYRRLVTEGSLIVPKSQTGSRRPQSAQKEEKKHE